MIEKPMGDPKSEWAIWEPITTSSITIPTSKRWSYKAVEKPPKKGYKLTVDEERISCKINGSVCGVVGYIITGAIVKSIERRVAWLTLVSIDERFLKDVMSLIGSYLAATYDVEYLVGDEDQRPNLAGVEDA